MSRPITVRFTIEGRVVGNTTARTAHGVSRAADRLVHQYEGQTVRFEYTEAGTGIAYRPRPTARTYRRLA